MLTSWKSISTSIEYPLRATNHTSEKKKKAPRKSLSQDASNDTATASVLGAQFVQYPSVHVVQPAKQGGDASSVSKNTKKKRKHNNGRSAPGTSTNSVVEDSVGPVLCVTSPHRVVFMESAGDSVPASSNDKDDLKESKSRNYVTRPGSSSRFSLSNRATNSADAFGGLFPAGAQYDPVSNLIFAIRDSGAEVAVWTAAPSSTLPGPDDDTTSVGEGGINGKKVIPKKRKTTHDPDLPPTESVVSQRLQMPEGKVAVTLTPFSTPTAVGASGCCEDGSVWIAIRVQSSESCDKLQLLIVDATSIEEKEAAAGKSKSKRKSSAKIVVEKKKEKWSVLDSNASASVSKSSAVFLTVHSVIMSQDKTQVARRYQQVRIPTKEGDKGSAYHFHLEKSTKHNILNLESSETDVAVKLDESSLSLIHRKLNDRWMFTSVMLPKSDASVHATRTFPLPVDAMDNGAALFSFGKVGQNSVAMLTKSPMADRPGAMEVILRIIDFQRKAELSSLCWNEGVDDSPEINDGDLGQMLQGKRCFAMVTSEYDGSIALLTSSKDANGCLDVVYSRLESGPLKDNSAPTTSAKGASLVSSLRSAAMSASNETEANLLPMDNAKSMSAVEDVSNARQEAVDEAVDAAIKLLTTSSKELLDLSLSSIPQNGSATNGKSKKGSGKAGGKSGAHIVSWTKVYEQACSSIAKAEGGNCGEKMINGMRGSVNSAAGKMRKTPKRFVEAAFKETASILIALHEAEPSAKAQKNFQKTTQEVTSILIKVFQTNMISARADYGIKAMNGGNAFLSVLQSCPSTASNASTGKLHAVNAMLEHVRDIPENFLVLILRLVLRKASVEDAVAYYLSSPELSKKGTRLSNQYKALKHTQEDQQKEIGARILSQAVRDFTLKVVTYSNFNHSFLSKALRDSIKTTGEVETLLLILGKLLKSDGSAMNSREVSHSLGTINWISALTDAHMGTILKITNEGGLVVDRIQRVVRTAMAQSELANQVRELSDFILSCRPAYPVAQTSIDSSNGDSAIVPYSMERLAI